MGQYMGRQGLGAICEIAQRIVVLVPPYVSVVRLKGAGIDSREFHGLGIGDHDVPAGIHEGDRPILQDRVKVCGPGLHLGVDKGIRLPGAASANLAKRRFGQHMEPGQPDDPSPG